MSRISVGVLLVLSVGLAGCTENSASLDVRPYQLNLERGEEAELTVSANSQFDEPVAFELAVETPDFVTVTDIEENQIGERYHLGEAATRSSTSNSVLIFKADFSELKNESDWQYAGYEIDLRLFTDTQENQPITRDSVTLRIER